MNESDKRGAFSRAAFCLVAGAALAGIALPWWAAVRRPGIAFLPAMRPARWIVYPVSPDPNAHQVVELPTIFETGFELGAAPPVAVLRVAAFARYELTVNGSPPGPPRRPGCNWKQPDEFDVAGQLHEGANRIQVVVTASRGPPALWLSLTAGPRTLNTGPTWRASYAGAAWRAAALASDPKAGTAPDGGLGLPRPLAALRNRWPTLLGLALLSAAGCWLAGATGLVPGSRGDGHRGPSGGRQWARVRNCLVPAVLAGSCLVLALHDLVAMPYILGFDANDHLGYIRYIREHAALPAASEGWEMFQPPLYYLVSAAWLGLLGALGATLREIAAIRLLGLPIAVTQVVLVWATLRLLFPLDRFKPVWGSVLAAVLPPALYLSQYVTNEAFAAMLVSASLYLTLRALRGQSLSWTSCAGLGLCLGAALLAKSSALLVVPAVAGALLWKWWEDRPMPAGAWAARLAAILALAAVVGGWHGARLWLRFGNPLIGNWDPAIGFPWWQDDGYRTSDYYLRLGGVLADPWAGASRSFAGGIYATLWGDGMLGGAGDFFSRPPWNYDLMAVGYWLSLLPTLAVIGGAALALGRFLRRPSAEWFLLLASGGTVLWALIYMSLVVPSNAMAKAFYGLSAILPICALGAEGLEFMAGRSAWRRALTGVAFGLWAANAYATFWISPSAPRATVTEACALVREGRESAATALLTQRLRADPANADLQFVRAYILTTGGDVAAGARQARAMMAEHPGDCRGPHVLAIALAQQRQPAQARDELRRVMALAPNYDPTWGRLAPLLFAPDHADEIIDLTREALASAPFGDGLRLALGVGLLAKGQPAEAAAQFRYAAQMNPRSADVLAALAWRLATDPDPAARHGEIAVLVAEQACALARPPRAAGALALAAACAEAGRLPAAIQVAARAEADARAAGDLRTVAAARELLAEFQAGRPYRTARPP